MISKGSLSFVICDIIDLYSVCFINFWFRENFTVLNVSSLNALKEGTVVNLDSLVKEGILTKPKNPLKILGNGKLEVKLTVQAAAFTASAKKKIEEIGGKCEVLLKKKKNFLLRIRNLQ